MARFTVTISTENEAFQPSPIEELARILSEISLEIQKCGLSGFYETIFDINGNDVGRFGIKNEDGTNWNGVDSESAYKG